MEVFVMREDTDGKITELSMDEHCHIAGGTDYSYAYEIIGEIRAHFTLLIASGLSPEAARKQVKNEYWTKVLDICKNHPDRCGIEKQAQIIFMFIIGS